MKHIQVTDKKRLHQLRYTGVTEEKLQSIYNHRNVLQPLVEGIVEDLYKEILSIPSLRKLIEEHSTLRRLKKHKSHI